MRIEATEGKISLESREIWVSTEVIEGTLQYDQEVAIELTLEVLGGKYMYTTMNVYTSSNVQDMPNPHVILYTVYIVNVCDVCVVVVGFGGCGCEWDGWVWSWVDGRGCIVRLCGKVRIMSVCN